MKIAILGDTALYGKFSIENNARIYKYLEPVKSELSQYDYIVLNLETPFAVDQKPWGYKSAYIKSLPENVKILKYLGVQSVCLANNHLFDFGRSSYELTKRILEENGIKYFGVENKADLININNNKIAFTGFCCYSTNPQGTGKRGINEFDYNPVLNALSEFHNQGYNNIMSVHAGQEHVNYPNSDHIKFARKLSDRIPYVYYGHHPHVLQGIENYKDSLHFYSLGNFCFDDVYTDKSKLPLVKMSDNNKSSMIVSLTYEENKLMFYEIIPIFDAIPCKAEEKKQILDSLIKYSEKLKADTTEYDYYRNNLLNKYISGRKQMRNIRWYLKRLNLKSIRMILNAYSNKKFYVLNVKKFVND